MESNLYNELLEICHEFRDKTNIKKNYIEFISALLYISVNDYYTQFLKLYNERNNYYIADLIDEAIGRIQEDEDKKLFSNVKFKNVIVNREIGEENVLSTIIYRLYKLIKNAPIDEVGRAYQKLIEKIISDGELAIDNREFYTPTCITDLMADSIVSDRTTKVFDPICGSGNFLVSAKTISNCNVIGEESNINYYNICKTNLLLNNIDNEKIRFNENDFCDLREKADVIMMNPPFSERNWISHIREEDKNLLREYDIKPTALGDYVFLLLALEKLSEDGKMAIVMPHGALFRNGETGVRKKLIEKNYIKAIIGLPENLFLHNRVSVVILILSKEKNDGSVFFVDASKEYINLKKNYEIPEDSIKKLVEIIRNNEEIEGISHIATKEEIEKNGYNLTIKKYVKSKEEGKLVDKEILMKELYNLEKENEILDENIKDVLEVLGKESVVNFRPKENTNREVDYVSIGEKIRNIRIKKNMTMEHLALELNVSASLLYRIESGISNVSLSRLVEICNALNVDIKEVL